MVFSLGRVAKLLVLVAGQAWRANAECAYRLDGYLDIAEPHTLVAPVVDPGSGYRTINQWNPLVYLADTEDLSKWNRTEVSCDVTSWRYQLTDGEWPSTNITYATNVTFPDANRTEVAYEDLFAAEGVNLQIADYPPDVAVAIADSLFGRVIEVFMTCDQSAVVAEEDACVPFYLNFTNSSPEPDIELLESALHRFQDPAVPGVVLPAAGDLAPWEDTHLNKDNPITNFDGSTPATGCNGEISEYLGEDGEWYWYFTGSDGMLYNMTHVFYATEQDHLNIAKIQSAWSPNLEHALFNRTVRLTIYCNNINDREEGYLLFRVGDGSTYFDISLDEYESILSGGAVRGAGAARLLTALLSFAVAGILTLAMTAAP